MPADALDSLPSRPLTQTDFEQLNEHDSLDVAPFGGKVTANEFYAALLLVGDRGYAVGFDEDAGEWTVLDEAARDNEAAVGRFNETVREWAADRYGDEYDNESVSI